MNPQARLLAFLPILFTLFFLPLLKAFKKFILLAIFLLVINFIINKKKSSWRQLSQRLWVVLPFIFSLFLINWLISGKTFDESIAIAADISSRLTLAILASWVLIMNSSTEKIIVALNQLIPFQPLSNLITLGGRYFQIFLSEATATLRAKKARDIHPKPLKEKMKILTLITEKIVLRSFDRAEFIYVAMLSRGYQGQLFYLTRFSWSWHDCLLFLLILMVSILIFIY